MHADPFEMQSIWERRGLCSLFLIIPIKTDKYWWIVLQLSNATKTLITIQTGNYRDKNVHHLIDNRFKTYYSEINALAVVFSILPRSVLEKLSFNLIISNKEKLNGFVENKIHKYKTISVVPS